MTAVVIVTFGRVAFTRSTIDTLLDSGYDKNEVSITVVDNGSQPEMVAMLTTYRRLIDNLVLLNENRGKPYAWNLGARVAQERCNATDLKPPDYFLFCDNDIEFKPGWHEKMEKAYAEHQDLPLCCLSAYPWPSHAETGVQKGPTTEVNVVKFPPGWCIMISAEMFRVNGPWDTRRLIRTVDTCYYRNAQNRGYLNASIHPETLVTHMGRRHRSWHIQTGNPKLLP